MSAKPHPTREATIAATTARIRAELPRHLGSPRRVPRGPCETCGAPVPPDARIASYCKACLKVRYQESTRRARAAYVAREIAAGRRGREARVMPDRSCGCARKGPHARTCRDAIHLEGRAAFAADLRKEIAPLLVQATAGEGPAVLREAIRAFLEAIAKVEASAR